MKSIRNWIRNVFGFSGNEINGFLILLPLMLLLVLSEPLYHTWIANSTREQDSESLDSIVALWDNPAKKGELVAQPVTLFHFDPNTVSVTDLLSLGFTERSATRIAAYRQKGGVFRIKSDLLKIYGLDSALYNKLYGYISLPASSVARASKNTFPDEVAPSEKSHAAMHRKAEAVQKFDINTADTLLLKSVYGIGSRLATRIVKFRDGLGGFVNSNQLFEVYGLDSTTVVRLLNVGFIKTDFIPVKININTATEDSLSAHPYISYHLARLLVAYRFQHGDFRDVNDIKKLSSIPSDEVDRLLPYLTVGD